MEQFDTAKRSQADIEYWFKILQDGICDALEEEDGKAKFREDLWERPEGGGGRTRIISGGNAIEKGGVLFSAVGGKTPTKILKALQLEEGDFYATGVSIVIHPKNPFSPIIHMNTRYFEMSNGIWWFGGGIDLTPHYVFPEDGNFFHQQLKDVCDRFDHSYYPSFKDWADNYFYLPHRNETRGIGGIFFDRLTQSPDNDFGKIYEFVKEVGRRFAPVYCSILRKNKNQPYGEQHKNWQRLRRGRYVEFNLLYDKGTKFGLETNGRTESILMSLPPIAEWEYNYLPEPGTKEAQTLEFLKKGIDWISMAP